ncbi:CIC11C00000005229 [Sungouiella intermedia]|uniref:CIC11C00000005229 n=1 Tax=Sungouiella intermedia TaxID=45354 RepID=A0A1L0BDL9_9ASCO|nr:CIC11C00000005229 [[Candida] intermedia]
MQSSYYGQHNNFIAPAQQSFEMATNFHPFAGNSWATGSYQQQQGSYQQQQGSYQQQQGSYQQQQGSYQQQQGSYQQQQGSYQQQQLPPQPYFPHWNAHHPSSFIQPQQVERISLIQDGTLPPLQQHANALLEVLRHLQNLVASQTAPTNLNATPEEGRK